MKPTQRYAHLELEHLRSTHNEVASVPVDFDLIENDISDSKDQWMEALTRKPRMQTKGNPAHSSHTVLKIVK